MCSSLQICVETITVSRSSVPECYFSHPEYKPVYSSPTEYECFFVSVTNRFIEKKNIMTPTHTRDVIKNLMCFGL